MIPFLVGAWLAAEFMKRGKSATHNEWAEHFMDMFDQDMAALFLGGESPEKPSPIHVDGREFQPGNSLDLIRFGMIVNESYTDNTWNSVPLDSGGMELMMEDYYVMLGHDRFDAENLVAKGFIPWLNSNGSKK
jgi:hypothetical protein